MTRSNYYPRVAPLKGPPSTERLLTPKLTYQDGRGNRIPAGLTDAFLKRHKLTELATTIDKLRMDLMHLCKGGTPMQKRGRAVSLLRMAMSEIRDWMPYAVCPECARVGQFFNRLKVDCPTCGSRGWLSKIEWEKTYGRSGDSRRPGEGCDQPSGRDGDRLGADDPDGRTQGSSTHPVGGLPGGVPREDWQQGPAISVAVSDEGVHPIRVWSTEGCGPDRDDADRRTESCDATVYCGGDEEAEVASVAEMLRDIAARAWETDRRLADLAAEIGIRAPGRTG